MISNEKTFRSLTFFDENLFLLVSHSREGETVVIPLNQKLPFVLFAQQTKHLHVHHRSVLVQVCFFESTELLVPCTTA